MKRYFEDFLKILNPDKNSNLKNTVLQDHCIFNHQSINTEGKKALKTKK